LRVEENQLSKNYGEENGNPFPATICASINDQIVHGIPSEKVVFAKKVIFLKIDIGMVKDGYCSDMARTYPVGKISPLAQKLISTTEDSFWAGVQKLRDGGAPKRLFQSSAGLCRKPRVFRWSEI